MTDDCVVLSQTERDMYVLKDIIKAEYRWKRAKILIPIWPYFMKCFPFPRARLKIVNFLLNAFMELEMKIH
jgi:hypothetical protein